MNTKKALSLLLICAVVGWLLADMVGLVIGVSGCIVYLVGVHYKSDDIDWSTAPDGVVKRRKDTPSKAVRPAAPQPLPDQPLTHEERVSFQALMANYNLDADADRRDPRSDNA